MMVVSACGDAAIDVRAAAPGSGATEVDATPTPEVSTAEVWEDIVAIQEQQAQPPSTPSEGTPPPNGAEMTPPGTRDLDGLLLTTIELGGTEVVGPMSFSDEPQYGFVDCAAMVDVFAAHAGSGRRIRADLGDGALRMSGVDLGQVSAASAVLDAADSVWNTCGLVTTDTGEQWWIEPIDMPAVVGWRTAGLAFGVADDLIWTIGWYQQGGVVVFADYDAASPWAMRSRLDAAIAARLSGGFEPIEAPTEPPVLQQAPTATPPPTPSTETEPNASWLEHPAAVYVPEAEFFGEGWTRRPVTVLEAEASDPADVIEGCSAAPPPQMAGLEVAYETSPPLQPDGPVLELEVIIGVADADAAMATLVSFRALAGCSAESLQGVELRELDAVSNSADEVVAFEVTDADAGFDSAALAGRIVLARHGADLIGVIYAGLYPDGHVPDPPTVDELIGWIDQWAADASG